MSTAEALISGSSARTRRVGVGTIIAAAFLVLVVIVGILAPLLAPHDPDAVDFTSVWDPPSSTHLLGADQLGRDVLSRVMAGTLTSLIGPIALLLLASVLGIALGLTAAWTGGWVDQVLQRLTDVLFAMPGLLFVILLIAAFGKGTVVAVIGLGIAFAPVIAKFTRSIARSEMSTPYVDAYRIQGLGGVTICSRYVLPNLAPQLTGYLVVLFGDAVIGLATIGFLGFGAAPPSSEWGVMVQENQGGILQGHILPSIAPAIAISLVVLAVNIIGIKVSDRLQDRV